MNLPRAKVEMIHRKALARVAGAVMCGDMGEYCASERKPMRLPPENAIICRVWPLADGEMLIEPLVPREPELALCMKHPRPIYFDSEKCPCCELMRENEEPVRREMPRPAVKSIEQQKAELREKGFLK